jgi:RNA methyltransferase, TrmH family
VIEGPTLLGDALDAGLLIEAAFAESGAPPAVDHVVERLERSGVPVHEVAAGTLARVVDAATPQAIAAVAPLPEPTEDACDAAEVVLVLIDVADPGNAGALVRTAEAAGVGAVLVAGQAVDPYSPKCVRASAGSIFRLPTVVVPDAPAGLARLRRSGHRTVGTGAGRGSAVHDADLLPPLALVLGNEAHGLGDEVTPHIDEWIHVPMAGGVESLNVAATGAVVLFEAARQRGQPTGRHWPETAG